MENMNLKISSSPHVRSKDTTSDIMFDVLIALMPALGFGLYMHGWYAGLLVAVCVISCVGAEALYQKAMKLPVTVGDYSAAVTGVLLGMNLPPKLPIWMAVIGSAFAIIVVKQLFGGLGQNFMNPALAARCFLLLSFSKYMTDFVYDGVSTATPLNVLKAGGEVNLKDMFIGRIAGTIGETSVIAILIGAAYLLIRKVISPKIPLIYIGSFAVCIAIYAATKNYNVVEYTAEHLCGGGLMLGAWFMATDYVTSPITSMGKVVYAIILGMLTFVLRIFGGSAEGVSYAIIISNLLVPLIERVTVPKAFGAGAELKDKKEEKKSEKKEVSEETKKDEEEKAPKKPADVKGVMKAIAAIFAITVIMGGLLGVVYSVTKDPITKAEEKAKEEAYKAVCPELVTVEPMDTKGLSMEELTDIAHQRGYTDVTVDAMDIAYDADEWPVGFIITMTNSSGYGGDIQMVIGIGLNKEITGVSFLKLNESAGLGMEAKKDYFITQFYDKAGVEEFVLTKNGATSANEIDAISGATITSSAVVDTINAALRFIK